MVKEKINFVFSFCNSLHKEMDKTPFSFEIIGFCYFDGRFCDSCKDKIKNEVIALRN